MNVFVTSSSESALKFFDVSKVPSVSLVDYPLSKAIQILTTILTVILGALEVTIFNFLQFSFDISARIGIVFGKY